jgi:hypothetical protein
MPLRPALALFLAFAGSCAASQPLPSVPLAPELDTVLRDYERAWVAKGPQALARLFTGSGDTAVGYGLPGGGDGLALKLRENAHPPGPRPHYGPDHYAAFVVDPDGVHIEAVDHGTEPSAALGR